MLQMFWNSHRLLRPVSQLRQSNKFVLVRRRASNGDRDLHRFEDLRRVCVADPCLVCITDGKAPRDGLELSIHWLAAREGLSTVPKMTRVSGQTTVLGCQTKQVAFLSHCDK
mgnify:CR=1 FL=1